MSLKNIPILILEDDPAFRDRLNNVCSGIGKTWVVGDVDKALGLLIRQSFRILLLDWNLIQTDHTSFILAINSFQQSASRIALFKFPQLNPVISAMKTGMSDVLWTGQPAEVLKTNIEDVLSQTKSAPFAHSSVSRLAESLAERAVEKKMSFSNARKEFSKTFLFQVLGQKKMRRSQLASLMSVSTRTLHRHLSA